jgi:flagellar basal-body rod modification protein FlgD
MSTVAPTGFNSPLYLNDQQTTGSVRTPKKMLDQEDFLKLLAVQFQTQDPMKPIEDTAFIAQMAQFSSLDQMNQLRKDQQMMTSAAYLGRTVTVQDPKGKLTTGLVSAIDNSGSAPALVINGTSHPMSSVKRIEPSALVPGTGGTNGTGGTDNGGSANPSANPAPVNPYNPLPNLLNSIRDRVTFGQ